MEFWALPPEINSARIYSGPGSGPLLTAATAWDELAATLHTTARAWQSVISGLTSGFWHGPASMSMATAGAHYISWLVSTCTHAEQAAARARAAAAAYEAARATIVPPPVIAANRSLLALLVATNVLGQNGPAIAATEAHYGQMWAQDVAVMYAYAAASAAASTLTPFTAPPAVTDPAGLARQSLAVARRRRGGRCPDVSCAVDRCPGAVSCAASTSGTRVAGLRIVAADRVEYVKRPRNRCERARANDIFSAELRHRRCQPRQDGECCGPGERCWHRGGRIRCGRNGFRGARRAGHCRWRGGLGGYEPGSFGRVVVRAAELGDSCERRRTGQRCLAIQRYSCPTSARNSGCARRSGRRDDGPQRRAACRRFTVFIAPQHASALASRRMTHAVPDW